MSDPIAESAASVANGEPPRFWATAEPSIGAAVHNAVNRVITSGIVEQTLDASITKTITTALQDMTGTYSEFGKSLKQQLAASLACGPDLDLPSYGHLVLQVIRRQVDTTINHQLAAQVEGTLKDLLDAPPASIKLTELVAEFIQFHRERRSLNAGRDSLSISLHVTESSGGFRYIAMDPEDGKAEWACSVRIGIYKDNCVFSLSIDKQDIEKRLFAGPLYGFERLLFRLLANKTPIEFDTEPSDIDTHYYDSED